METKCSTYGTTLAHRFPVISMLIPGLLRKPISEGGLAWLMRQSCQLSQKLAETPCALLPSGLV
jgi:hypothetical protein